MHMHTQNPRSRYGCLLAGAIFVAALGASAQQTTTPGVTNGDDKGTEPKKEKVVELESFTVTGYRSSLQKSLETKRESAAIIDVITAEDIGKFPDTNVAESLSHLTGISIDHIFGEGEMVSILGTDPAL